MRALPLFLLFAVLTLPAGACRAAAPVPVRVEPGSALLDATRIPAGVDSLELSLAGEGGAQRLGVMVLETRPPTPGAPGTLTRVERLTGAAGGVVMDSFVVALASFAPVFAAPVMEDGRVRLDFQPGRVLRRGPDGATVEDRLPGPAFYGNAVDLLLGALPLAPGFRATLPLYRPDDGRVEETEVVVEGEEELRTADGGRCWAWRVRVESGAYGGVYWIAGGSHVLVRYRAGSDPVELLRRRGCGGG